MYTEKCDTFTFSFNSNFDVHQVKINNLGTLGKKKNHRCTVDVVFNGRILT